MPSTPTYGLRYPALSNSPNVPLDIQNLADDVEDEIERLDATVALLTALPTTIRKPSNESVTLSTALQDDDHFAFTVAANSVYTVESFISYTGAADPAGGLQMAFSGPAGATFEWSNFGTNIAVAAPNTLLTYNVVVEAIAAGSPRSVGTNGGTAMSCQPAGTLVTSGTSGTFRFRWAQSVSNATATVVRANSWMRVWKIS